MVKLILLLALLLAGCSPPRPLADIGVLVFNENGHGSGFIVDANSIITARHVADQNSLTVRTNDGQEYRVTRTVKASVDAARLYVDRQFAMPPVRTGTAVLRVGDRVVVIGTPECEEATNCVLPGHVVKINLDLDRDGIHAKNLDIIDAHSSKGCSGGPVLYRGKVVGIVVVGSGGLSGALPIGDFVEILP
jgi:S1-C subfamily serine protease